MNPQGHEDPLPMLPREEVAYSCTGSGHIVLTLSRDLGGFVGVEFNEVRGGKSHPYQLPRGAVPYRFTASKDPMPIPIRR